LVYNYSRKTKFCAEYGSMDIYYNFSHPIILSLTFCPAQGYPLKILAPIPLGVINPQHQPFISPIFNENIEPAMI
jgi:hypothetical protein